MLAVNYIDLGMMFMNVILIYARIKDKLTKEDAYELNKLYMSGLTYKEAMDKLKEIKNKTFSKE
ncbi:hypothetical protein ClosIBUN13A_CONTIG92g01228 [Clostridium sp. IBUN13A]|nr:hypothetical protein ClosIBUN13A_CONTIG92g01228 [Clostridium sp. IBUN13A]KJZ84806.1 hypothetical protein ClosIBUN125C_CONTIG6g00207 [Clostridium sp. IBUN125C]KJZ87866.1 hypothetical protein ClosIBUN22A_CONTIG47g00942 [Clostridium sp. IBUN22A]KJZ95873.1 hypothetical protein ClosIBUN62F_CONTIG11g00497 [Clostridium sp. IBUN62F]